MMKKEQVFVLDRSMVLESIKTFNSFLSRYGISFISKTSKCHLSTNFRENSNVREKTIIFYI